MRVVDVVFKEYVGENFYISKCENKDALLTLPKWHMKILSNAFNPFVDMNLKSASIIYVSVTVFLKITQISSVSFTS